MSKEKFVPVNGAYNITSAQVPEFTQFLRNKIKANNKFTPDGKPSKSGVITKTFIDGKEQQFRNRALKGDNSVNKFGFASQASKNKEIAKRDEAKKVTTPKVSERKQADKFIRQKTGPGTQIDHRLTLARLLQGVKETAKRKGISIVAANLRMANSYAKEGYGHHVDNLQKLTDKENNFKNVQENNLDKYYKHLANKPNRSDVNATKAWNTKRVELSKSINPKYSDAKMTKTSSPWKAVKGFTTGSPDMIQTDVKSNEGFKLSDFTYTGATKVAGFGTV
tara:strand:- start:48 stop:884 length:837 start_codon:yes stop_codon:yes gene_type:complete